MYILYLVTNLALWLQQINKLYLLNLTRVTSDHLRNIDINTHSLSETRRETSWNLQGCLKLPDRSQPLVGRSSPYYEDMWRTYWCLASFFPIVDTCLSCEDIARQSCAMLPRWRFLASFLRPVFSASRVQQVSDLHSKFALRPHHVWKYGRHPIRDGW